MRILFAHNAYQQRGGEDRVVEQEVALLREAGHVVELYMVSNHAIQGAARKVKVMIEAAYSPSARDNFADALAAFKPDVVHVHNTFPLLTASIYDACKMAGVPVVQTLHNFRTTCANAMLLRNGKVCETCVTGSAWWGALRRCYRGSLVGSLALAHVIRTHKKRKTWHHKVDRLLALTAFQKSVLVRAGMPAERIDVLPNFTPDPFPAGKFTMNTKRSGALFVGRLSPEKGVDVLLKAWEGLDLPLKIIGDGPLRAEVEQAAARNPAIEVLGHVALPEITQAMQSASFLLIPSIWYEGFPMTLLEAYSCGLPVVASKIGSLDALVQNEGWHVMPGDAHDLRRVVAAITPQEALKKGERARATYERNYTPKAHLNQLEMLYRSLKV